LAEAVDSPPLARAIADGRSTPAALALPFIERGVVQLPFALQEQITAVSSLFKRYDNVPASLADAALIRLAEINDGPLLLTTDSDFHIYRRHGRQTIPLISP
jgi:predicted nucleic acid-binding protein